MLVTPSLFLAQTTPSYVVLVATIIASMLAGTGVAALVGLWMNRKKPAADIHESRARAARDFAEADEIQIRASLTLGEEATHWTQAMMKAQREIFRLQYENDELKAENRRLKSVQRKQISGG